MVLGRIFPKITNFYLDGSPSEAEIVYPDKVRRVHIRLGGQEEQITAGPEGVIYITKGYPSVLQIKWALKLQKKKFLPYFKFLKRRPWPIRMFRRVCFNRILSLSTVPF